MPSILLLVVIITASLGVIVGLSWWTITFKATPIRKVEFIFGVFAIVFCAIIWRFLLKFPGGVASTGITLPILSIFYFVFSFALFNGIGFIGIFKKSSYKDINAIEIIGAYVLGVSIAIILTGTTWQLLLFPGAKIALLIGLILMVLITIITSILHLENKINNFKSMFKRIVIYGSLGIILYLTPYNKIVDLYYTPRWAELKKKELANPYDLEIQEEWALMRYQEDMFYNGIYVFLKQEEIDDWQSRSDYFMLGDQKIMFYAKIDDMEIIGSDITDLSVLRKLTSIRSLKINNTSLTNLEGLENLTSIGSLHIIDNDLLTDCAIQSVCDLIAGSPESIIIQGNAPGCNNLEEVGSACGF